MNLWLEARKVTTYFNTPTAKAPATWQPLDSPTPGRVSPGRVWGLLRPDMLSASFLAVLSTKAERAELLRIIIYLKGETSIAK